MGRCCLRANALARFHAICCKLKHRVSLAREDIRVHAHQDVRSWFKMKGLKLLVTQLAIVEQSRVGIFGLKSNKG